MTTSTWPDANPKTARFDGPAYQAKRDNQRLTGQLLRVWQVMRDEQWRTLEEIAAEIARRFDGQQDPQASISAQLRHLRKERFGGHAVNRRHVDGGLWQYQVVPAEPEIPETLF